MTSDFLGAQEEDFVSAPAEQRVAHDKYEKTVALDFWISARAVCNGARTGSPKFSLLCSNMRNLIGFFYTKYPF